MLMSSNKEQLTRNWVDWCIKSRLNDTTYLLTDHLGGFNQNFRNEVLDQLPPGSTCYTEYLFPLAVKQNYPDITLKFSAWLNLTGNYAYDVAMTAKELEHRPLDFKNFICSFNRSKQLGRQLLTTALFRRGWFNPTYSSKHFETDSMGPATTRAEERFYRSIVSFEFDNSCDHKTNLRVLAPLIQANFLTIVSEVQSADSYIPFWTEKFLYPIANQRLWVAFAPPGFHKFISRQLGFRLFTGIDYRFDGINNHATRLEAMLDSVAQFESMSVSEQQDFYALNQRVIAHNYNHLINFDFYDRVVQFDEFDDTIDTGSEWTDIFGIPENPIEYKYFNATKSWQGQKVSILPNRYK